ncbi:hypothetical protein C8F01DRAFT_1103001 [Mycena amicta]|nr:hypothetical protein C8F01DRAFT_1103001 [Mycena amicta]
MAEIAVGVWSLVLQPKKKLPLHTPASIRLTNVALGDVLADESARTTIKLTHDKIFIPNSDDEDEDVPEKPSKLSTVICSLTPGKIEQAAVNIILEGKEDYTLESVGPNGAPTEGLEDVQQTDMPPFDDSDLEEDFDLREVSSDVEMDADEIDDEARFEEIDEAVHGAGNLKRVRNSDAGAGEAEKGSKKQKNETGQAVKEQDKKTDDIAKIVEREIAGGIKIKDTKIGTGPTAKKGNTVAMRYIGRLTNTKGKIFDQNVKGKPFTFQLGKGEVIKGWDEGIVGMQVGGERLLTLPPAMGYGKRGTDGIPGGSTLIFEVKLVHIK